ncbi:MAG: CSLREA domain-containing protein, partial [candidate division Zixibacteria bacterium]|nr:CSLREA domain-containing protein [candidate division Zixibacteria bacterium]
MNIDTPKKTLATLLLAVLCLLGSSASYAATFTVTSSEDTHDAYPGDGIASDQFAPDSGDCSLRAAIEEANALAGPDTILVPGAVSPVVISLGSLVLSDNGTTVTGDGDLPVIDGVNNPFSSDLFVVSSDSNVIRGLVIQRARRHGVYVTGADNLIGSTDSSRRNHLIGNGLDRDYAAAVALCGESARGNQVVGNYIGLYGNGTSVNGNRNGVLIETAASTNTIGGISAAACNYICASANHGVLIRYSAHNNTIAGNSIGLDITGLYAAGNGGDGILCAEGAYDNTLGGDSVVARNLIAGNDGHGIRLDGWTVTGNTVGANWIGTDVTGRLERGNGLSGVAITGGATWNYVGSLSAEGGNVISGNKADGVHISGERTDYNTVVNNQIGLDERGIAPLGNGVDDGDGVRIDGGARYNTIGGSSLTEANAVSGNLGFGIHLTGVGTSENTISANFVGINIGGSSSVYNLAGVVISGGANNNVIGGVSPGQGNVISGNRGSKFPYGAGVMIMNEGSEYNRVIGNLIGTDYEGTRALRNGSAGVILADGARYNTIGGPTEGERNVISGNGSGEEILGVARGVHIYGSATAYNKVVGNYIGTAPNGETPVLNIGNGVGIYADAHHNQIGGPTPEEGNLIRGNGMHGVYVSGANTRLNSIRHNRIFENDSLGIAVRNGAQDQINRPLLDEANTWAVQGYNAPAGAIVDIYRAAPDSSGRGEGSQVVGSDTANAAGEFYVRIYDVAEGEIVTAVVTDRDGNTSEFAINRTVVLPSDVDDPPDDLPTSFAVTQNYPNPFNPTT